MPFRWPTVVLVEFYKAVRRNLVEHRLPNLEVGKSKSIVLTWRLKYHSLYRNDSLQPLMT